MFNEIEKVFMERKLLLLLTGLLVSIGFMAAQISRVTGVVKSAEDDLPIIGATVLVEGTGLGTVTDMDGKFEISNLPSSARTSPFRRTNLKSEWHGIDKVKIQASTNMKKGSLWLCPLCNIERRRTQTWILKTSFPC